MANPPQTGRLLAVTALGPLRAGLLRDLIREVTQRGCNILDCRSAPLGQCLGTSFLVGGNWSALGRLETALPSIGKQLQLQLLCQRCDALREQADLRPYAVDVVAPERADLLNQVIDFFHAQTAQVAEAVSMNYATAQTGAAMCNLHLTVYVPINQHPQSMRDAFLDLCDELNADGVMDPIKA